MGGDSGFQENRLAAGEREGTIKLGGAVLSRGAFEEDQLRVCIEAPLLRNGND